MKLGALELVGEDEEVDDESVLVLLLVVEHDKLGVQPLFKDFEKLHIVIRKIDYAGARFEPVAGGIGAEENGVVANKLFMNNKRLLSRFLSNFDGDNGSMKVPAYALV